MKQLTLSTTIIIFFIMMIGCGKTKGNKMDEENSGKSESKTNDPEKEITVISTKFGDISLEFFDELAPKHVESFKLHAQNDYYNGTIFHRVIPGFMIQGGDPLTRSKDRSRHGTGGNAAKYFGVGKESEPNTWDLPAEFSSRTHSRGILSMARSQDPDSGGSQFFICVADAPFLNGQYTVFGRVIKGMDVVDQIVNAPRDQRDNPNDRIEMEVRIEKR